VADLGDAIFAILSADSTVQGLVPGTTGNTTLAPYNIFGDYAPEAIGVKPYIVYKRISGVEDATLSGDSDLCDSRIQIDCIAPTYAAAKAIKAAVFNALQAYVGTIGGVTIQSSFQVNQHSFSQPSPNDQNLLTFGRSVDFQIWHVGPA
jgi:hypothetical protein